MSYRFHGPPQIVILSEAKNPYPHDARWFEIAESDWPLATDSNILLLRDCQFRIPHRPASAHRKIAHVRQTKSRNTPPDKHFDPPKLRSLHILQREHRPLVRIRALDLHTLHLEALGMADKEPIRRSRPKHVGFRILLLLLGYLQFSIALGPTSAAHHNDLADFHV